MKLNALLIGPEDTPYEYGMFEFQLSFPNGELLEFVLIRLSVQSTDVRARGDTDGRVTALTTNMGRTRFNPNVLSCAWVDVDLFLWESMPFDSGDVEG
jgi:hypothetical protein